MKKGSIIYVIIIVLAVLLCIVVFVGSPYLQAQKSLGQQQAEAQAQIAAIQQEVFSPIGEFYSDGPQENMVVATVNGWPITEDEIYYRIKARQSYNAESDANYIFNILIEEKVCLANAQTFGVLPSMADVHKEIDIYKQEVENQTELGKSIKGMIADWGITDRVYWEVWNVYNVYRNMAFVNFSNKVKDAWWSETGVNPEISQYNFYYSKVLEAKKIAKVKMLEKNNQYQPILDRLFMVHDAPVSGITLEELLKQTQN